MTFAATKESVDKHRELWASNLGEELAFWSSILNGTHPEKGWCDRARISLTSGLTLTKLVYYPLSDYVELFPEELIEIADVGSGPVIPLVLRHPTRYIRMTHIDPLAEQYGKLLDECGYKTRATIFPFEAEHLDRDLPDNHFHIAWSCNALDHAWNPLKCIKNMIKITRPKGKIILKQHVDEGVAESYHGLHRWNFRPTKDGQCELWNHDGLWNINREVENEVSDMVVTELPDRKVVVVMTKK